MTLLRILITLVISFFTFFVTAFAMSVVVMLMLGQQAFDRGQAQSPSVPAILTLTLAMACGIVTAVAAWRASLRWLKQFVADQITDTPELYTERGGGRYRLASGWTLNATWPFAQLLITTQQLNLRVLKSSFVFAKADISQLRTFRLLFSPGLEITNSRGQTFVFWSYNIERLTAKLRSFGYDVESPVR